MNKENKTENQAIYFTNILLPPRDADMSKWAVIACDQYTSDQNYWNRVAEKVGDSPSTYHLTFPECYLGSSDEDERIHRIAKNGAAMLPKMRRIQDNMVLVARSTPKGDVRHGLVGAIDLDLYSYEKGSSAFIRASEETIIERIPPRLKIRENSPMEFPHILLLADDPENILIGPLTEKKDKLEKLYDFDLMKDGGHVTGYKVSKQEGEHIPEAVSQLADPGRFYTRYGTDKVMLFAVGDGNHSLATAKTHWQNIRKTLTDKEAENHPARYALVEVENIYDPGIQLYPIHRVIFEAGQYDFFTECFDTLKVKIEQLSADSDMDTVPDIRESGFSIGAVVRGKKYRFDCEIQPDAIPHETVQTQLDRFLSKHNQVSIDYIHGTEHALELANANPEHVALFMPAMKKEDLFQAVVTRGVLPRKAFSMGEAEEKRFYIEGRKIR